MLKLRTVPPTFYHDYMRFRQSMNKNYIPEVYIRLTKEDSSHYQMLLSMFGLAFPNIRYFPPLGWCITRKGGDEYFEDFDICFSDNFLSLLAGDKSLLLM